MSKSMNDDPIEGFLQQGVKVDEIRNALLQMKKVKKRKNAMRGGNIPKPLKRKIKKMFDFKWQSPPKIIIKIENHFHSNVDSIHQ